MEERTAVKVSFRADKSGQFKDSVTAVIEDGDGRGWVKTCYAHVGQHGTCHRDWYRDRTRPAKPEEYADLLKELEAIGYDVTAVSRLSW